METIMHKCKPDASSILGRDFITPAEISSAFNARYCFDDLVYFDETMPSLKTLQYLHCNGFLLIARPPANKSLLEIREQNKVSFRRQNGGWFAGDEQFFSRSDKVGRGWLMIRKKPLLDSTEKIWKEQRRMIPRDEYVPNVAEMAWGILAHWKIRNILLLPDFSVRTSSTDADDNHVSIGRSAFGGINVYSGWDEKYYEHIGIISARDSSKNL